MATQEISRRIAAPVAAVWQALVDPVALEAWRAPDGMACHVHEFVPVVGGAIRVSLTYRDSRESGKSGGAVDTYAGRISALEPGRRIVEDIEFETDDATLVGKFQVATTLTDLTGSTLVTVGFSGLPPGVDEADNAMGTEMSLARLARLVESVEPGV